MQKYAKSATVCLLTLLMVVGLNSLAFAADEHLRIGTVAEASGLDPRINFDVYSIQRMDVIMESLMTFETDLSLAPRLAEQWEFSDDGQSITFHLREGVTFHHGRDFTAEDVKYTFEWILNPDNPAANRDLFADIVNIEIIDDYTIVFELGERNSFIINNIARMNIVPADLGDDEDFASNPVGTGPYVLDSWERDDTMILTAFDDYWGGPPNIDIVEFLPIPEDGTRLLAFEGGEIDLYQGGMVPGELARIEAQDEYVVQRTPGTGYTYLGFNTRVEPLDNVSVRQAIAHLIPREAIVDRLLEGIGRPGISMLSPELAWYNDDVKRFNYDPERARELLAEAGYADADLSFSIRSNEDTVRVQIAEILQHELEELGISTTVNIEEFGAYNQRILNTDDYELFLFGWGGQIDPDRAMIRQFHSQGSNNYAYYENPRVDELLDEGRRVPPDSPESIEIYNEAQEIIVEEAPFAYVFYTEEIGLHHAYVSGWNVHPHSSTTFRNIHQVSIDRNQ